MEMKRPFGITLIGYFYIFGAIVLLLTLGVKQEIGINIRFGVPNIPETVVRILIIVVSFIIAYGYLNLKKWGYLSMIIYSILFLIISLNQVAVYNSQPFIGNAVFSLIVLIYTVLKRNYFNNKEQISL
jgi:CDP-diglyceride synthetase